MTAETGSPDVGGDGTQAGHTRPKAFVHVGAPKTGTTFLQNVLWANRRALAAAGLLYPGTHAGAHHNAALELRGASFGGHTEPAMVAAWDRLVSELQDWDGDVIISSELLAWATREQAHRAIESLAPGFDVHIMFTARDLARQIPAVWQEEMKNRRDMDYPDFLQRVIDSGRAKAGPAGIWGGQDPRLVMRSWARDLPATQVHVITVPPPGGPRQALWDRFCSVVGIDPTDYDLDVRTANVGLGFAEAELLRRVNSALPDSFKWPAYRSLVKHGIAEKPLAERVRGGKPPLPDEVVAAMRARTDEIVDYVASEGFQVTGDLEDLRQGLDPTGTSFEAVALEEQHISEAGVDAIATLLQQLARSRRKLARARAELKRTSPAAAEESDEPSEHSAHPGGDVHAATTQDHAPSHPASHVDLTPRHRPGPSSDKTVFLFVGSPKTGLDRVRELLWKAQPTLAAQGIHLPGSAHDHFLATTDLRGVAHEHPGGRGAWGRLAREVTRADSGTWIVAHELFAAVGSEQAAAALEQLSPAQLHIVVTTRGLDRQIPAEWLESLRHGGVTPFAEFTDEVVHSLDPRPHTPWFWRVQDPLDILERWRTALPRDQLHIIPVSDGPQGHQVLWARVCAAVGVDPASIDPSDLQAPAEPRAADAELLRQLNESLRAQEWAVKDESPTSAYGRAVREVFANQVLARVPESSSVVLPTTLDMWVARQVRAMVNAMSTEGYDVIGDLAELVPGSRRSDGPAPEALPERAVLSAAVESLARTHAILAQTLHEVDGRHARSGRSGAAQALTSDAARIRPAALGRALVDRIKRER